jgi:hypothetical protein
VTDPVRDYYKTFRDREWSRLERAGHPEYVFAFHENDEIGPRMLARISRHTGLTPGLDFAAELARLSGRSG